MDDAALRALLNWAPSRDTPNVVPTPNVPPTLERDGSGKGSFIARASFQFPDGGRFALLLSGTADKDGLMLLVEDDLGLTNGFVTEMNNYLLSELTVDGPRSPGGLVNAALKMASRLFDKQVFTAPNEEEPLKTTAQLGTATTTIWGRHSFAQGYCSPQFGESRLASVALMKQLRLLTEMDTRKEGFTAEPMEDNLYRWKVNLYFDDVESCTIASELAQYQDSIKLEFRFPAEYPTVPPIVRVLSPYILSSHVLEHGGICMELLTTSGWAPVNSIDAVCIQIRAMLIQGNVRIAPSYRGNTGDYTFDGAMKDLKHIVMTHRWNVPQSRPRRLRS